MASPRDKILASQVKTLTLHAGRLTKAGRTRAIPQLKCIGGNARGLFEVDSMRCQAQGTSYDDNDVQWTCTAETGPLYKLGSTQVLCEGYEYPDDPYVLKGSCGVEYRLMMTEQGEREYHGNESMQRRKQQSDIQHRHGSGSSGNLPGVLFMCLFAIAAFTIIYNIFKRWNENRQRTRQDNGIRRTPPPPSYHDNDDEDDDDNNNNNNDDHEFKSNSRKHPSSSVVIPSEPPPPYTSHPSASNPGRSQEPIVHNDSTLGRGVGVRVGTLTGAAALGALGGGVAAAQMHSRSTRGSEGSSSSSPAAEASPVADARARDGQGRRVSPVRWRGGSIRDGGYTGSGSSYNDYGGGGSSSTASTSTGFGGTTRR